MDLSKLLELAGKVGDVPGVLVQAGLAAGEIAKLAELIVANHARAKVALSAADVADLTAIHAETLTAIDAFDAELAEAAAR
jgi:hypothetical protein